MKPWALFVVLALAAPFAVAQTSSWTPDPSHTAVEFSVRHMGLSTVHGRFGKVTGAVQLNEADPSRSTVQVTIDVTGVDTGVPARDADLKSANFFDVANFPTATFTSTSVARSAAGFTANGNLTVHGITKPVVLQIEGPDGPIQERDNKWHAGYTATTTVSRLAFGLGTKYPVAMIGDDIKLTIEVEVVKQ